MKTKQVGGLLLIGLILGYLLSIGMSEGRNAVMADNRQVPPLVVPRFHVSAWSISTEYRAERGCYMIDTATGELWFVHGDEKPVKISGDR